MPGMDGGQLAELLRREYPSIGVILLTGVAWEIAETALRIVDVYVRKGEGADARVSAIAHVLTHVDVLPRGRVQVGVGGTPATTY